VGGIEVLLALDWLWALGLAIPNNQNAANTTIKTAEHVVPWSIVHSLFNIIILIISFEALLKMK